MNLTKLKPISADVQLAQSGELVDGSVTEVHDHLDLYENAVTEAEEAEMYRWVCVPLQVYWALAE